MVVDNGVLIWWVSEVIILLSVFKCCICVICFCKCLVFVKFVIKINCFGLGVSVVILSFIKCLFLSDILWLLFCFGWNECWIMLNYFLFLSGLFSILIVIWFVFVIMFWLFKIIMFVGIVCIKWFS